MGMAGDPALRRPRGPRYQDSRSGRLAGQTVGWRGRRPTRAGHDGRDPGPRPGRSEAVVSSGRDLLEVALAVADPEVGAGDAPLFVLAEGEAAVGERHVELG